MNDSPAVVARLTLQLIFSCICIVPTSRYASKYVAGMLCLHVPSHFGSCMLRCIGVKVCVVMYDFSSEAPSCTCIDWAPDTGVHPNKVSLIVVKVHSPQP